MFERTPTAPPDAIFGLAESFRDDPNPDKINLGIGIYRNEEGDTPVLEAVKKAEQGIWSSENTKSYLPIEGSTPYAKQIQQLLLGDSLANREAAHLATAQTPGGTGAIRVAADVIRRLRPSATAWVPDPTWVNHTKIFDAAGLAVSTYPYLDSTQRALAHNSLIGGLGDVASGDIVILHGCCHNPSGVDPSPEQWHEIASVVASRGALPLVDIAYQGFGQGLTEDRLAIEILIEQNPEIVICNSFSKNFALYNERVGGLTVVTGSKKAAEAMLSQIKASIRVSYSNPPAHGASIVMTILQDAALRLLWESELTTMRSRIEEMRRLFVQNLDERQVKLGSDDNHTLLEQNGMFSFSGLDSVQIERLRHEYSIYMLASSRINFAAMTRGNMNRICDSIASITKS